MKPTLLLLFLGLSLASTSCCLRRPHDSVSGAKQRVEQALPKLAAQISATPQDFDAVCARLETYLAGLPEAYGAAWAVDPEAAGRFFAPYVYRDVGKFARMNLDDPNYNYPAQAWFAEPRRDNRARWSDPYFDEGGGNIWMITYSVPVHARGKFLGIVTTDLPARAPAR